MNKEKLLDKKNVVGVGKGHKFVDGKDTGRDAVVVFVSKKEDIKFLEDKDVIPQKLDGLETDVIETGEFYTLRTKLSDHKQRHRPVVGGISGGVPGCGTGTINGFKLKNDIIILSNFHVLGDGVELGSRIWQPGPLDGGIDDDYIGYLVNFVPVRFSGASLCPIAGKFVDICNKVLSLIDSNTRIYSKSEPVNKVDLAWGESKVDVVVSQDILGIGTPTGFSSVVVGDKIKKSGRTTGVKNGTVLSIDATVRINFGGGRVAFFEDQIVASHMSEPGDSGSLVLNSKKEIVGLLFAGSSTTTLINKIDNVLEALGG